MNGGKRFVYTFTDEDGHRAIWPRTFSADEDRLHRIAAKGHTARRLLDAHENELHRQHAVAVGIEPREILIEEAAASAATSEADFAYRRHILDAHGVAVVAPERPQDDDDGAPRDHQAWGEEPDPLSGDDDELHRAHMAFPGERGRKMKLSWSKGKLARAPEAEARLLAEIDRQEAERPT